MFLYEDNEMKALLKLLEKCLYEEYLEEDIKNIQLAILNRAIEVTEDKHRL